jgi:hypothetical protein
MHCNESPGATLPLVGDTLSQSACQLMVTIFKGKGPSLWM